MATQLLFLLYPEVEQLGEEESRVRGLATALADTIETLVESPFFDIRQAVSNEALSTLVEYGAVLECEGIALSMAHIEDSYTRRLDRVVRKEKQRRPPNAELHKLAEELDVPFEDLVSIFAQEHSEWWETSAMYGTQARTVAEEFLGMYPLPAEVLQVLRPWESGMAQVHGSSSEMYVDTAQYAQGLLGTKTCIELFLTYKRSYRAMMPHETSLEGEASSSKLT